MNVIGSRPDGWWNDPDRAMRQLVEDLNIFAAATGDDVTVAFDRRPDDMEPGRHGDVSVTFASRQGRDAADDKIVVMVAADEDPDSLVVVTSDRELATQVREFGAQVVGAGGFRERLDGV